MRWLRQWAPVAIWAVVILASSNDRLSSAHTQTFLASLFGPLPEWVNLAMRKTGHVLAYGLLGVLAFRAASQSPSREEGRIEAAPFSAFLEALLVTFAVSAIDEWHQSYFRSRTGTPWDVVLDCCGALLAILIVFPAMRARLSSGRAAD